MAKGVQSPNRFGILFLGPRRERLLCVNPNLGAGVQSSAQLVRNMATSEILVRKTRQKTVVKERVERLEREVNIVNHLRRQDGPKPLFAGLRDWEDLYIGEEVSRFTRVSYWDFYNVGTMVNLYDIYNRAGHVPPPAIIARALWQVLATIQWMMHDIEPSVLHTDAHDGNVFVNWPNGHPMPDFILGDFGDARRSDEGPRPTEERLEAMTPTTRARASSPATEPSSDVYGNARKPWDVDIFLRSLDGSRDSIRPGEFGYPNRVEESTSGLIALYKQRNIALPQDLRDLIRELWLMNREDEENNHLPEYIRPRRWDLTDIINRAKNLEVSLLARDRDAGQDLNTYYRQVWDNHIANQRSHELFSRPTRAEVMAYIDQHDMNRPFEIIDLDDEEEISSKAALLQGLQDSYLLDSGSSDDDDLDSPSNGGPGTPSDYGGGSGNDGLDGGISPSDEFPFSDPYIPPHTPDRGGEGPGHSWGSLNNRGQEQDESAQTLENGPPSRGPQDDEESGNRVSPESSKSAPTVQGTPPSDIGNQDINRVYSPMSSIFSTPKQSRNGCPSPEEQVGQQQPAEEQAEVEPPNEHAREIQPREEQLVAGRAAAELPRAELPEDPLLNGPGVQLTDQDVLYAQPRIFTFLDTLLQGKQSTEVITDSRRSMNTLVATYIGSLVLSALILRLASY